MKILNFNLTIFGILFFCLTGCDKGYPPVVVNEYPAPVEILIVYDGHVTPTKGIIPSMTELVQRQEGRMIVEIKVTDSIGNIHDYQLSELNHIRSETKTDFEIWILNSSGIRLGTRDELQKVIENRDHKNNMR